MRKKSMIRALQVTIGDGSFGGVANFLYTYYGAIDHGKIHFDFLYCGENSMQSKDGDPVLADSNITTLHILKRNNNGFSEYRQLIPKLKRFFRENHYDIVHVNSSNPYVNACIAYVLKGRCVYIAHAHSAEPTINYGSKPKQLFKKIIIGSVRKYITKKADALYACSVDAGFYLFGKNGIKKKKFKVIHNAIDVLKYQYDPVKRNCLRNTDYMVIGFVGRLSDIKNPMFAIDVFAELLKKEPNAELWMIGEGELRSELEEKVKALSLTGKVILYGYRDDVSDLMQAMDVLLFPSLKEGLGLVAVEAQCSGLPVLASDQVPRAANVAGLITYLPLSESVSIWSDRIIDAAKSSAIRIDLSDRVKKAHYDIHDEARILEKNYQNLLDHRRSST